MMMSHVAAELSDLSPIQRSLCVVRKGRDRSDRAIGRNSAQILISQIIAMLG